MPRGYDDDNLESRGLTSSPFQSDSDDFFINAVTEWGISALSKDTQSVLPPSNRPSDSPAPGMTSLPPISSIPLPSALSRHPPETINAASDGDDDDSDDDDDLPPLVPSSYYPPPPRPSALEIPIQYTHVERQLHESLSERLARADALDVLQYLDALHTHQHHYRTPLSSDPSSPIDSDSDTPPPLIPSTLWRNYPTSLTSTLERAPPPVSITSSIMSSIYSPQNEQRDLEQLPSLANSGHTTPRPRTRSLPVEIGAEVEAIVRGYGSGRHVHVEAQGDEDPLTEAIRRIRAEALAMDSSSLGGMGGEGCELSAGS